MYCIQCGAPLPEGAAFCARCGAPAPAAAGPAPPLPIPPPLPAATRPPSFDPVLGTPQRPMVVVPPASPYAGFWRRLVAVIIDGLILMFVTFPINLMLHIPVFGWMNQEEPNWDDLVTVIGASMTAIAIGAAISWLYSAILESSKLQGTLGKMALNIKVTDLDGRRISFLRATGRHLGKFLSKTLLMIGYLIQPFTRRRQALHDLLAGTLVVRRGAPE